MFYFEFDIDSGKSDNDDDEEDEDEEDEDDEDERSNKQTSSLASISLPNGESVVVPKKQIYFIWLIYFQRDPIDLSTSYNRLFDELFDPVRLVIQILFQHYHLKFNSDCFFVRVASFENVSSNTWYTYW